MLVLAAEAQSHSGASRVQGSEGNLGALGVGSEFRVYEFKVLSSTFFMLRLRPSGCQAAASGIHEVRLHF